MAALAPVAFFSPTIASWLAEHGQTLGTMLSTTMLGMAGTRGKRGAKNAKPTKSSATKIKPQKKSAKSPAEDTLNDLMKQVHRERKKPSGSKDFAALKVLMDHVFPFGGVRELQAELIALNLELSNLKNQRELSHERILEIEARIFEIQKKINNDYFHSDPQGYINYNFNVSDGFELTLIYIPHAIQAFLEAGFNFDLTSLSIKNPGGIPFGHLNLEFDWIERRSFSRLLSHPFAEGLEFLSILYSNIRDADAKAIASTPRLVRLKYLDLSGNILDDGIAAIANSRYLRLRSLVLDGNLVSALSEEAARSLANSRNFGELRCFSARQARFRVKEARYIAASAAFPQLEHLILAQNSLGHEGIEAILTSKTLHSLQYLDVSDDFFDHGNYTFSHVSSEEIIQMVEDMPDFKLRFPYLVRINNYKRVDTPQGSVWKETDEPAPALKW